MTDTLLQTRSSTAVVLEELQLYGWRPFTDEPDPRPLPEPDAIRTAVADIFDALVSTLSDTRLEPDLEDLLWSTTNLFHRTSTRINRDLDSNEQAQKRAQREQDGSEVRSVELETLIAEGITLIERRNAFEAMRDLAAELFETHLGQTWHPRTGSHVNRRTLTASLIDSRDHLDREDAGPIWNRSCPKARRSPSPAGWTATITRPSGRPSTASTRNTPTWSCCTAAHRAGPNASPPPGPTTAA